MNAPRWLMAAGTLLFVVGGRLEWLDSESFGSVAPHHLLPIGGWVYLPLVPLLLAPLAPARWLLPLAAGWLIALAAALFVALTAGDFQPAWPYNGTSETPHPGVFVSMAGAGLALGSIWWALGHESGPLTTRRWIALAAAALLAVAVLPLYEDLRGEADEDRLERRLARQYPGADVDVVCRGGGTGLGPNCAWRYERDDGGESKSLTENR
jgi:hypothetical protein